MLCCLRQLKKTEVLGCSSNLASFFIFNSYHTCLFGACSLVYKNIVVFAASQNCVSRTWGKGETLCSVTATECSVEEVVIVGV